MKPRQWSTLCVVVTVLIVVVVGAIGVIGTVSWLFFRSLSVDYGALPTTKVFQWVFRKPVPSGVSHLKVTGHGFGQGHQVWMRFKATDAVIKSLTKGEEEEATLEEILRSHLYQFEDKDALSVGWDEIRRIKKPEYCPFDATNGKGSGWYGFMVIDRKRRIVYLHAGQL